MAELNFFARVIGPEEEPVLAVECDSLETAVLRWSVSEMSDGGVIGALGPPRPRSSESCFCKDAFRVGGSMIVLASDGSRRAGLGLLLDKHPT